MENNNNNKLDSLQKDVVKLEVKIEHLEKQQSELKSDMRLLQQDIDKKFDEFEKMLKTQFSNINDSLKEINDLVSQGKGARKAIAVSVGIVTAMAGAITWVFDFIK